MVIVGSLKHKELKAKPFIFPKKNTKRAAKGYAAWYRMIKLWQEKPELFKKQYYLRSKVEGVFSMMKTTLLDGISSKTETAQINELLIRIICHNLAVIIEAIFKWGIDQYKEV